MTPFSAVRDLCTAYGIDKHYWIAFSGGLDSTVLLALMLEVREVLPIQLHVLHVNHHLSLQANRCADLCERENIDYREQDVYLDKLNGASLEEAAREKRYAFFEEQLAPGDVLLTAHQQDDQAETVLLQLLRGAGVKGLSAMPTIKTFGKGFHARPLLPFSRAELLSYARCHELEWLDDESNQSLRFMRNFIRHEVIPTLTSRFPDAVHAIARSAQHCGEAQSILETFATEKLFTLQGSRAGTLSVAKLLTLAPSHQRLFLRTWIHQAGMPMPDAKKMETIRHSVLTADWDKLPIVKWKDVALRRYRDDLFLIREKTLHDPSHQVIWQLQHPLTLPNIGILIAEKTTGSGLKIDTDAVTVRFRQGGERIALPNRGVHTLKNLFHEWNILPWERDSVPLIFIDDQLIAIVGYAIAEGFNVKETEEGYQISLI
jgi:tRNA(Ile)-lysidine synthase